ncbi:MAG: type II toxin-antitoxin system HicB family antitoxin [Fimbriimonas ginsengisoli]|uniref:Type II toxin-antitoxin system HicB family antitoxin n=1 Tax=Fimbriimonas ginsengisoli TaxID=1005039 RepID=A0A931PUH3_FIMGI|nr:type II toxin-antitoxin system HicB family antitoxin [Fimbriimonas ginsengisoli]
MDEQITIVIEPGDQGWWIATVPEVPGAVSQGRTEKEAREMVLDCLRELMAFRREAALQNVSAEAKIERIKLAG